LDDINFEMQSTLYYVCRTRMLRRLPDVVRA
jgi:hypothetical protein